MWCDGWLSEESFAGLTPALASPLMVGSRSDIRLPSCDFSLCTVSAYALAISKYYRTIKHPLSLSYTHTYTTLHFS